MSEQYERTSKAEERMTQYLRPDSWLFSTTVHCRDFLLASQHGKEVYKVSNVSNVDALSDECQLSRSSACLFAPVDQFKTLYAI